MAASSNENGDRVKLPGKAIDWSDAQLDKLATVNAAVIAKAKADAKRYPLLNKLLKARAVDG